MHCGDLEMSDGDGNKMELELLRSIDERSKQQSQDIRKLQDSMLRFETHGYHERLNVQSAKLDAVTNRLIILETQGKAFTAGLASVVSAFVAIVVSWFKAGQPH